MLLRQSVHPKVVRERLGHASIGITLDTYSDVMPGMQQEEAGKIDAGVGGGSGDVTGLLGRRGLTPPAPSRMVERMSGQKDRTARTQLGLLFGLAYWLLKSKAWFHAVFASDSDELQ